MGKIVIALLALALASALTWESYSKAGKVAGPAAVKKLEAAPVGPSASQKLLAKASQLKSFAKKNDFNSHICFLIDMSLPSHQKRFFVYDLQKDSVESAGLVTHGNCNQYWMEGRKYGNSPGCGCTSLGKYKIGNAYSGRFGLAFKLYGLDKTNDNAFQRYVVLHSHSCVPDRETESEICQSNGCPTVSPAFLKQLEPLIRNSGKPVLLWIFDDTK
jgi:hypothetical protein